MIITVHVKPNAKETRVVAWLDERTIAIALHAPATEGKANEELLDFLSDKLNIPKTFVFVKRGLASRVKHIEIPDGTSLAELKN